MSKLNGDELISLLRSLPELVVSSELGLWVSHSVVPFILQHTPQCMVSSPYSLSHTYTVLDSVRVAMLSAPVAVTVA